MKTLVITIHTIEPLLLSKPASGEENSSTTYDHIPGSAIRGAVIQAYMNQKDKQELDIHEDSPDRRLFFDGGCVFLNGYPTHPETKTRSLPVPFLWQVPKDEVLSERPNFINMSLAEPEVRTVYKSHTCKYFTTLNNDVLLHKPSLSSIPHNASTDANRKDASTSTIFRYTAISSGQSFKSAILCATDDLLEIIKDCLADGVMFLGGSHRAGYGRVQVETELLDDWVEFEAAGGLKDTDTVSVTLLSDAIIRDEDGRSGAGFDEAFSRLLGLEQSLEHLDASRWQLALVGGYNRKWGLPLPQEWAYRAGSTFVYAAADFDAFPDISLLNQGIGERKTEGFGRIAVNLSVRSEFQGRKALSAVWKPPQASDELSEPSAQMARSLVNTRLKYLLDRKLAEFIGGNIGSVSRPPRKSQLSRLRNAANRAYTQADLQPLVDHLANLTRDSGTQFDESGFGGKSLRQWLLDQAEHPDIIKLLNISADSLPSIGSVCAEVDLKTQARYTALAISGLMRALAKKEEQ